MSIVVPVVVAALLAVIVGLGAWLVCKRKKAKAKPVSVEEVQSVKESTSNLKNV